MLALPLEIRQLLRTESIKKNIRIHFPNGEWNDITNDNIEYESVSFTESICSQNNLKFGLCEASVFEVTVFGVANIKGCDIEVCLEIDISSLSTELIEQYGTTSPDVSFPYYRVPYGTFTVDSCKRQADMSKRHIVAYSQIISDDSPLSPAERVKMALPVAENNKYDFDLQLFLYSNIKNVDTSVFEVTEIEETGIALSGTFGKVNYKTVMFTLQGKVYSSADCENEINTYPLVGGESIGQLSYDEVIEKVVLFLQNNLPAFFQTPTNLSYLKTVITDVIIQPFIEFNSALSTTADSDVYVNIRRRLNPEGYLFYPYIGGIGEVNTARRYCVPTALVLTIQDITNLDDKTSERIELCQEAHLYTYTLKEEMKLFDCTVAYGRQPYTFSGVTADGYVCNEKINLKTLINAYIEINGLFGSSGRGAFRLINLQKSLGLYPEANLYPAEDLYPRSANDEIDGYDYRSLWYEEYEVQPFGKIVVDYKDAGGKSKRYVYEFDSEKKNVYYFKDNYIFDNYFNTEAKIKKLLDTCFIPNIKNISYVPVELTMKGLPHIEAGDAINVFTRAGGVEAFVFRRTLSGIQNLIDDVEASGDEFNEDTTDTSQLETLETEE